ncbi:hypothetical protein LEN26_014903 [Aphanomyces euteiches]|nr:hypothetical protein LEN26_014903 [Aphanomyces euteiches]KAH9111854.1 hypothetical protein AeMF1_013718 [Aphanomyces euteiches]KAH9182934.1 hypothetical protein AeNC1_015090 [Aphanomyces euteiches]
MKKRAKTESIEQENALGGAELREAALCGMLKEKAPEKKPEKVDINAVLQAMTEVKETELRMRERELELRERQALEEVEYKRRKVENEAKNIELQLKKTKK